MNDGAATATTVAVSTATAMLLPGRLQAQPGVRDELEEVERANLDEVASVIPD